jgi:cytoskeletal protein CcmA (bactofilin family)
MKRSGLKFSSEEVSGFLDQGTSVTGELQFSGTLRIDGEFHGSITTKDKLIVGERAQVHADIKAGEVEVYGSISGTLESNRRVEVHPSGSIKGDVRTPELVIEAGGILDGNSRMAGDSKTENQFETSSTAGQELPGG